jgi:hypothetical protein
MSSSLAYQLCAPKPDSFLLAVNALDVIDGTSPALLAGSRDATIRMFQLPSAGPLGCWEAHSDWVCDVKFLKGSLSSGKSLRFASASCDRTIKLWDVDEGDAVATLKEHNDHVKCLEQSDGYLFSASLDRLVVQWDLMEAPRVVNRFEVEESVYGLAADGHFVAAGMANNAITLFDHRMRDAFTTLRHDAGPSFSVVRCLSFSAPHLRSGNASGDFIEWDMRMMRPMHVKCFPTGDIRALVPFTPREIEMDDHSWHSWLIQARGTVSHLTRSAQSQTADAGKTSLLSLVGDEQVLTAVTLPASLQDHASPASLVVSTSGGLSLCTMPVEEGGPIVSQPWQHCSGGALSFHLLSDRRHVVTAHRQQAPSKGLYGKLWDLQRGLFLQDIDINDAPDTATVTATEEGTPLPAVVPAKSKTVVLKEYLESLAARLDKPLLERLYVPPWCSVDCSIGTPVVHLSESTILSSEMYTCNCATIAAMLPDDAYLDLTIDHATCFNVGLAQLHALLPVNKAKIEATAGHSMDAFSLLPDQLLVSIRQNGAVLHRAPFERVSELVPHLPQWVVDRLEDTHSGARNIRKMYIEVFSRDRSSYPDIGVLEVVSTTCLQLVAIFIHRYLKNNGAISVENNPVISIAVDNQSISAHADVQSVRNLHWNKPGDMQLVYEVVISSPLRTNIAAQADTMAI